MGIIGEVTFEIIKKIGTIHKYGTGWAMELCLISWNKNAAKYDCREWSPNHDQMSRGITLTKNEFDKLVKLYENAPSYKEIVKKGEVVKSYLMDNGLSYKSIYDFGSIDDHEDLRESPWSRRLTLTSWTDGDFKYDIRSWEMNGHRMTRGKSFKPDEFETLIKLYKEAQE